MTTPSAVPTPASVPSNPLKSGTAAATPPTVRPSFPAPVHYISFMADINASNAQRLLDAVVKQIQQGAKTVCLAINTMGGEVATGIALHSLLQAMPCTIVTHNVASVNSIGNVVFLAGKYRYANVNSTFMFHSVGIDVKSALRLEQKNTKEILDSLSADTARMAKIVGSHANFPSQADVEKLFVEASTKDAAYAKQHGIIHDVMDLNIPHGSPIIQIVL